MVFVVVAAALSLSAGDGMGQGPAGSAEPDLPVSVERVRRRLQRPSVLRPPPDPEAAHFKVEIEADYFPRETALEMVRRELAADPRLKRRPLVAGAQPLASVDLIQLAMMVKTKLSAALRARAERISRRDVQEALAEFCAVHDCSVLEEDPDKSPLQEGILTH
jgi:hypothetical protein